MTKSNGRVNQWGKIVRLPAFGYMLPSTSRHRDDRAEAGKADEPQFTDESERHFADLKTGDSLMDVNHNPTAKTTRQLLTVCSVSRASPQPEGGTVSRLDDEFGKRLSVDVDCDVCSLSEIASIKPPTAGQPKRRGGANPSKSVSGRGRKKVVDGENGEAKKPRAAKDAADTKAKKPQRAKAKKPRAAKDAADTKAKKPRRAKGGGGTQTKLQVVGDPVTEGSEYEDAFADDPFSFNSNNSPVGIANSYQHSRQLDIRTAGSTAGCYPTLAQRLQASMQGKDPSTIEGVGRPSVSSLMIWSVSQRSSRLFDAMLEQQAHGVAPGQGVNGARKHQRSSQSACLSAENNVKCLLR